MDWRIALVVVAGLAPPRASAAQEPRLAEPALARKLEQRVTLAWQGQELGPALERLAHAQQLPLWVDRRVDFGAAVELAANDQSLAEVLDAVARAGAADAWGWSTLEQAVYFGPRQSARELATLSMRARQAISQATAADRRRWLTPEPWEIPRLSEPRILLQEALSPFRAEVRNGNALPHDVWPARSLPAMAPIDRVVLVLVGFDLTGNPSPDGRQWRLAPIQRPVQLSRDYPRNERSEAAARALVAADADMRVQPRGRRLQIAARWEDHDRLRTTIRGDAVVEPPPRRDSPPPAGAERFTLKIENKPLGRVLEQLAAQLQLTLVWDEALAATAPPIADALVSCDVRDVDLDALLTAILAPAGCEFERDGQTVTIRKAR